MSHHGVDRGGVLAAGGAVSWGTGLQEALPLRSDRAGPGKRAAVPGPDQLLPLVLSSPIYTLRDIYTLFVGFQFSTAELFDEIMAYDARRLGTRFEVPFFLFQGETDVITLTTLAEENFAEVDAPTKGLALIKNAGHFAAFSQPDLFLSELLTWVRPLASAPSP